MSKPIDQQLQLQLTDNELIDSDVNQIKLPVYNEVVDENITGAYQVNNETEDSTSDRIEAYVSFDLFYEELNKKKSKGLINETLYEKLIKKSEDI